MSMHSNDISMMADIKPVHADSRIYTIKSKKQCINSIMTYDTVKNSYWYICTQ